ncbi:AsnC family transcriptional regulator [Desulfobotulus sp.]|jgi:DNA-binding Lrp family transcriptional regulator|uniref:siroheme decarboxylase subunit alpha n=1 Tax=Desulfobotulus sp. TaxID=1940337 RepID=UPI002A36E9F7|nr:AsnC family transcriptional regulator [Desulfobotulus sp.]MDY0164150.1 AsnC family transcriptional regulator [Desulfobotulus sp.]
MMDALDKKLLNGIQSGFPVCARPYAVIGERLGMEEAEVLSRLQRLKDTGIIRRIGGNFGPENLGYFSTLCAARVPEDKVDFFAEVVNRYPGVTHNYIRENDWNVWFTFIEPSREIIARNLEEIAEETGVADILNLPATHVFKIRAKFSV